MIGGVRWLGLLSGLVLFKFVVHPLHPGVVGRRYESIFSHDGTIQKKN
jgi:hypothetical protein